MKTFLEIAQPKPSSEPVVQPVNEQIGGVLGGVKQAVAGAVAGAKQTLAGFGIGKGTPGGLTPQISKVKAVQATASQQLATSISKFATNLMKSMKLDPANLNVLNASRLQTKKFGYVNTNHMVVDFIFKQVYRALKQAAPRETGLVIKSLFPSVQQMDKDIAAKTVDPLSPDIPAASAEESGVDLNFEEEKAAAQTPAAAPAAPPAQPAAQPAAAPAPAAK